MDLCVGAYCYRNILCEDLLQVLKLSICLHSLPERLICVDSFYLFSEYECHKVLIERVEEECEVAQVGLTEIISRINESLFDKMFVLINVRGIFRLLLRFICSNCRLHFANSL